jgi:hypothetical protein
MVGREKQDSGAVIPRRRVRVLLVDRVHLEVLALATRLGLLLGVLLRGTRVRRGRLIRRRRDVFRVEVFESGLDAFAFRAALEVIIVRTCIGATVLATIASRILFEIGLEIGAKLCVEI